MVTYIMALSDLHILEFLKNCEDDTVTIAQIQSGLSVPLSRMTVIRAIRRLEKLERIEVEINHGSIYGNRYHVVA